MNRWRILVLMAFGIVTTTGVLLYATSLIHPAHACGGPGGGWIRCNS